VRYISQERRDRVKLAAISVNEVARRHFEPTHVTAGKLKAAGTCLHCPDMPCIRYAPEELNAEVGFDMTFYASGATCAFDALSEAADARIPVIDETSCVGCGVCLDRCPVGAIYLDKTTAQVEASDNPIFHTTDTYTTAEFDELVDSLWDMSEWVNEPGRGEIAALQSVFASVTARLSLPQDARTTFGTLVRNLFIAVGLPAKVSVQGDTSNRIELACVDDSMIGIGELEYHDDLLDSARRLLSDTAVACSRHGLGLDEIVPMIVCLRLPNRRSGIYELLGDIETRLGLSVALIPAGALLLLVAFGHSLSLSMVRETFTSLDSDYSLEARVKHVLSTGRSLKDLGLAPAK
jgi:Fe-S-cluster-containing hydrogenase component 2